MTTLEQIEQQISTLQKQVEELKQSKEEKQWPQEGDVVWYVDFEGDAYQAFFLLTNKHHKGMLKIGNLFRTLEDAEREVHARHVVAALKRKQGAGGFAWESSCWIVCVEERMDKVYVTKSRYPGHPVYFDSKQHAEYAIADCGKAEIIKAWKWISGVKE